MMQRRSDNHGDWQGLNTSSQAPRYEAIAGILRSWNADRNVLDVGCGEGLLRGWLPKEADYLGIEPSALAIRTAIETNPSDRFVQADAEAFQANGERFGTIVFNEVLYYAEDPVGLVRSYASLLKAGGVVLCSIYQRVGGVSLKARLLHLFDRRRPQSNTHCEEMIRSYMARTAWQILDDRKVLMSGNKARWHVWLARPKRTPVAEPIHLASGSDSPKAHS